MNKEQLLNKLVALREDLNELSHDVSQFETLIELSDNIQWNTEDTISYNEAVENNFHEIKTSLAFIISENKNELQSVITRFDYMFTEANKKE